MGLCGSKAAESNHSVVRVEEVRAEERTQGRKIDTMLLSDHAAQSMVCKLLLLGAGQSGKSTLFKQMISIYGDGFPEQERATYAKIVFSNILQSIKTLLFQAQENYGGLAPEHQDLAELIHDAKEHDEFPVALGHAIHQLWTLDLAVKRAFDNSSSFQLNDSASYYLDKVQDICLPGYIPDVQDVLRTRVPTTGIVENHFNIEGNVFKMFDVGGQRSERKKWIHCFDNVTAVLFVAALSDFDQMLYEDENVNRMDESLNMFESIVSSKWFSETAIILFLNKRDIFAEKLKAGKSIRSCFEDYNGPDEYEASVEFIAHEFLRRVHNPNKQVYYHVTCATDRNNISVVFDVVKNIVIRAGLREASLMV